MIKTEELRRWCLGFKYGFDVPDYDGMMNEHKCRFLYNLVMGYDGPKKCIVEIGSYKGCSTTWLGVAGKRAGFEKLVAIDLFTGTPGWNQTFDTYEVFMDRMGQNHLLDFVQARRGDSSQVVHSWEGGQNISILHIDGDHAYEGVCKDIEHYAPLVTANGIVIFDDYDSYHPGVLKAVGEVLAQGEFQVLDIVKEIKDGYGSIALKRIKPL